MIIMQWLLFTFVFRMLLFAFIAGAWYIIGLVSSKTAGVIVGATFTIFFLDFICKLVITVKGG